MSGRAIRPAVDWPTAAVAGGVYMAFGLLTWFYHWLPWWLVLPAGGYVVCLHGSLQHEAVHGYPTRHRWLNTLIVLPSLWLWLPYTSYRETHTTHHRDEHLTSPTLDPESNYLTSAQWQAFGPLRRVVRRAMATLLGRLVLGPPYFVLLTIRTLMHAILRGDVRQLRHWLAHAPGVAIVLVWVLAVCRIPFGEYVLLFVYPGVALTLMRSYAEHRAGREVNARTAITETGPLMSLAYLNNNLHLVHHLDPGAPWHRRAAEYRARRAELLALNQGYVIRGYGELVARYLVRPKEPILHPLENI